MDISSLIGFLLAFCLIIGSILIGSAPITAFIDIPSILIVFGGSIGAAMICFPIKSIIGTPGVMMKVFRREIITDEFARRSEDRIKIPAAAKCLFDVRPRQRRRFGLVAEHLALTRAKDDLTALTFRSDGRTGKGSGGKQEEQRKTADHAREAAGVITGSRADSDTRRRLAGYAQAKVRTATRKVICSTYILEWTDKNVVRLSQPHRETLHSTTCGMIIRRVSG